MHKNIVEISILTVFTMVLINIAKFSIAKSYDWNIFLVCLSLTFISTVIDILTYRHIDNCEYVLKEKFILYKIIENKKDRIDNVNESIKKSRNENIIDDILLWSIDEMTEKIKGYNKEYIKRQIDNGKLITILKENHLSKKTLKVIKKELKCYNKLDDLIELDRKFTTQELIKKRDTDVSEIILSAIGFVLSIYAFFKVDFQSISFSANLIIFIIYLLINFIGTIEGYFRFRKERIDHFQRLQKIMTNEKI